MLLEMSLGGGAVGGVGGGGAPVAAAAAAAVRFALALDAEDAVDAAAVLGVCAWPQRQLGLRITGHKAHSSLADLLDRGGSGGDGFSGDVATGLSELLEAVGDVEGIGVRQCAAALETCKGEVEAAKALLLAEVEARRTAGVPWGGVLHHD
jgi:hypothetical protein